MSVAIKVQGLKEFRSALRKVDRDLGKGLRGAHKEIADLVAGRAKAASPPHVARATRGRANQREAIVRVGPKPLHAIGTVMGAKQRFGWYAYRRYRDNTGRQFPPWVGNQWDPGERGGMPYHVGPAVNASIDDATELLGDKFEQLTARAFPRG